MAIDVVVLNGGSSAGTTSIGRCLQELLPHGQQLGQGESGAGRGDLVDHLSRPGPRPGLPRFLQHPAVPSKGS